MLYPSLLLVPVVAWALWKAKRDYRRRGRLTLSGLISVCAMLFVPNLILDAAVDLDWPRSWLDWIGVVVATGGAGFAIIAVASFRSLRKAFCFEAGTLTVSGPYRWSRNPQYVGYLVFLTGAASAGWTWWCVPALLLCALVVHLLVLVEEQHLERVFGDGYRDYRLHTPRYLGVPR